MNPAETDSQGSSAKGNAGTAPLQIGDFRLIREIGRGGMGIVYEAEQVSLGRRVALKILPKEMLTQPKSRARFEREARAAARLHHTNIVPVFGVGDDRGQGYYVMQFIQGLPLDAVLDELVRLRAQHGTQGDGLRVGEIRVGRRELSAREMARTLVGGIHEATAALSATPADAPEPHGSTRTEMAVTEVAAAPAGRPRTGSSSLSDSFSLSSDGATLPGTTADPTERTSRQRTYYHSVAQIGFQVASALAYAHAQGVLHRDIKPGNLLLDIHGTTWVTDFGLAKLADDHDVTQTGDVLGTLRYMAPETIRGKADARSDVFSLGLTLYELLVLRPAFSQKQRSALIDQVAQAEIEPLNRISTEIPRDLQTIVQKSIEREPAHRYATALELAEDLGRFLRDEPIQARRASLAERYVRWARRNPGIAILGGLLTAVLVLATAGALVAAQRFQQQARLQRQLAEQREAARKEALAAGEFEATARRKADTLNTSLQAAQEQMRQTEYATRSNFALAASESSDVGRLRSLLDQMRPEPGAPDPRGWEWRHLWHRAHEERLTLRADRGVPLVDVAFSPDGKILASLEFQGRIQLNDRESGKHLRTLGVAGSSRKPFLGSGVHAVAFSPDGRLLAGPGPKDSLVLYSVETGTPTLQFEGDPGAVLELAWTPDGRRLFAAISTHVLRVWDATDGHLVHRVFGGHDGPVAGIAFSPDGQTVASASYDRTVKLWNLSDRMKPRAVLQGHADEVRAVAFSPDGKRLVSAGLDRSIRVWDADSGSSLTVIWGHASSIRALAFLPGSHHIVSGSTDETVRIWDTSTGQELRRFHGHVGEVVSVAVSPDGRDVAAACTRDGSSVEGGAVRIWDAARPSNPRTLQAPSALKYGGGVECVAVSPDGRHLATGSDDHAVRIWDLLADQPPLVLQGHQHSVKCIAFSPDGRMVASGGNDGTVRLWDAQQGTAVRVLSGHPGRVRAVVFSADRQTLFSASLDPTIHAWDVTTGEVRFVLKGHTGGVHDLALSPDSRILASTGTDSTCLLWDLATHQPIRTLRGHTDHVNAVVFSPDGGTMATGGDDMTIRVWNAADGTLLRVLQGHTDEVSSLAVNPDGRLASSGSDKTVRIWDPATGQNLLILEGHAARVRAVRFSPDGRTLVSASLDRTVRLWQAAPPSVLATPPAESVMLSPDP